MPTDHMDTPSGYRIPLTFFPATEWKSPGGPASVILMGALGMAARFYVPLAERLRDAGLNVVLLEQRGYGESALRPCRSVDFGFREALEEEVPLTMDWIRRRAPNSPVYLMGHSLGGHYAVITAGELGDKADHFRWARKPDAVVARIRTWLTENSAAPPGPGAERPTKA